MKFDWRFLRSVLMTYVLVTAAALGWLMLSATSASARSAVAGAVMSAVNFLLGFTVIEFSFEKSHTTFLKVVLGGMALRLLGMTSAVVVAVKILEFDALALMLALLGYYVLNLGFEIGFLQKKVALKKPS